MNDKVEIVVAMPVFNEVEGIAEFLTEIESNFHPIKIAFVVVDDASTDSTVSRLDEILQSGKTQLSLVRNSKNLGHGPSTIRAIDKAISLDPSYVMTVDGDGQFYGLEMRQLYDFQTNNNYEIVEGLRTNRNEPKFRKITSMCTRLLVLLRCHKLPQDANTPLRIYTKDRLLQIRKELGSDYLTPNLHICAFIRTKKFDCHYGVHNVQSLPRRGSVKTGTMWQSRRHVLPSKRFMQFTVKAAWQWIGTSKIWRIHSRHLNETV